MYDGEGNHRDEEKGNRFLHQAPSKKSKHLLALRLKGWHIWQFDPFVEKEGIIAGLGWPYLFILYFTRGIPLHDDYAFVQQCRPLSNEKKGVGLLRSYYLVQPAAV